MKIRKLIKWYLIKFKIIERDPFEIILSHILSDLPDFEIRTDKNNDKNEYGDVRFIRKQHSDFKDSEGLVEETLHSFDMCDGKLWQEYSQLKPREAK